MSKSVGNIFQLSEALDSFGGEAVVAFLASGHYRQPLAFSDELLTESKARVSGIRNYLRDAPGGDPDPLVESKREEFLDALADDFNTPRAFAALAEIVAEGNRRELAGARAVLEELLPLLGLEALLAPDDARGPRRRAPARRAPGGPRGQGLRALRRDPRRARRARLGGPRRGRRRAAGPQGLMGGPSVRAAPGAKGARWSTAAARSPRPSAAVARCAAPGARPKRRPTSSSGSAARPTTRAWSPRSIPIHTRTRRPCSPAEDALVVALDQIQDPQNLGAICRSAEAAGASGVVIPERRAAAVTPAVCKASAGAVEHLPVARVRNLADWLADAKGQNAWIYGTAAEAERSYTQLDWNGPAVLVMGSEGEGLRPRVAAYLRRAGLDPDAGQDRLAERVGGRGGRAVRGGPATRGAVGLIDAPEPVRRSRRRPSRGRSRSWAPSTRIHRLAAP